MDGLAAYAENTIATQTPGRLVIMLYEGAIRFLKQAVSELEAGKFAEKGRLISKAQAVIQELNVSLDMEAGGDAAQNLRKLYNFSARHLSEADLQKDPQRLRDVIGILEELLQGWKSIAG